MYNNKIYNNDDDSYDFMRLINNSTSIPQVGKNLNCYLDDPTIEDFKKVSFMVKAEQRIHELTLENNDINDTDEQGHTIISWLVISQYWDNELEIFIKKLVETWGVNINKCDNRGYTPIIWAAMFDRPFAIRLLLSLGADPKLTQMKDKDAFYFARECDNQAALAELNSTN